MNTILTDDERRQAIQSIVLTSPGTADQIARAIESAVLAKRAQQAPAAWLVEGMHEGRLIAHQVHLTSADALQLAAVFARHYPTVHTKPLYTHPSPQQADRQRVPEEQYHPDMDGQDIPAIGSTWWHSNGDTYTITGYADMFSDNHQKRPPRVIYRSAKTGRVWSRVLSDWYRAMKPFAAAPEAPAQEKSNG